MHRGQWTAILLAGTALPATAQTTPQPPADGVQAAATTGRNDRRVYEAAYFAAFSPATAQQIVAHVPGFVLEQGDQEVRGFAGAASNVVINGQRPSAKADTIDTILSRIPANRVLRVEIAPGDQFGADFAGKAQVLNLVLAATGGLAGTVEAGIRRDFTGQLLPQGSASALLRRGRSTFNASMTVENGNTSEEGFDRVRALPGGDEVEYRRKVNHRRDPDGAVAASWAYDDGTNRTAHLNARAGIERLALTQENHVTPVGGDVRDDRLTQRYATDSQELGGDVTRPLAGGGLKLVALATRRQRLFRDASFNRTQGGATILGGLTQTLTDRRDETLARLSWSRDRLAGWTVELGAEGALNRLDSQVDLFQLGSDGAATRIDLPIDHAVVTERRGEAFANAGRAVTGKLHVDLGLTGEASRLTVTGDATAERTLKFLKPKATLDWRPGSGWHAQLAVQRTVAQLQFEDFISGAELTNGRINGGNAQLLPQRAWEALATIEHPLLGDGQARLELGYQRISLLQDRVPTPDGFDAPGNLGNARVLRATATVDAPLGRLGIKGGRLTLSGTYYGSEVTDSYTLRSRPFSGADAVQGELDFRQDLRRFAWGFSVNGRTEATVYRLDELDRNTSDFPYVSAFGEWRPRSTTTVSLKLDNLAQVAGRRQRTFFEPSRRNPVASLIEERARNAHVVPFLSVRQSLG